MRRVDRATGRGGPGMSSVTHVRGGPDHGSRGGGPGMSSVTHVRGGPTWPRGAGRPPRVGVWCVMAAEERVWIRVMTRSIGRSGLCARGQIRAGGTRPVMFSEKRRAAREVVTRPQGKENTMPTTEQQTTKKYLVGVKLCCL